MIQGYSPHLFSKESVMRVRLMFAAVAVGAVLGLFQFPIAAGAEEPRSITITRQPSGYIDVRNADGPAPHGKIQSITTEGGVQTIVVLDEKQFAMLPSKAPAATGGTDAGKPPVANATGSTDIRVIRHSNGFIELRNADGSPYLGDVEVVAALIGGQTQRFLMVKDAGKLSPESSPAADESKEAKAAENGRYQVSGGEMPVMVDTATGQSWVLMPFGKNAPDALEGHEARDRLWWTWIPTRRVDDLNEAKELILMDRQFNRVQMEKDAQRSVRVLPGRSQPEKN
jgi:hypothetical protein